ncbi:zinc-finger domain-containing protein [Caedibacter taeniospiralis]|uniref:zinc-finger domain-containing protein n=1 Tax=Caedibacter taeniospiralis TaxID=28907 RepID=UPI001E408E88|nr:zinc-finger domain-containing protein [Caedibacter taeniospiralis]
MSIQKNIQIIQVPHGQRICCPIPEQASWNQHPRVYIDLNDNDEGVCPYCSTRFVSRKNFPGSHE